MLNMRCDNVNVDEIIKCGLNLTKCEMSILKYFIKNKDWKDTDKVADDMQLNLSTVQRAVKKLTESGIIERKQYNLKSGGYYFSYKIMSKIKVREKMLTILNEWHKKAQIKIQEEM